MASAATYKNYPFDEVTAASDMLIQQGLFVYQKFTCGECGSRQTIGVANTFYTSGRCEECGHITNIRETGCNYMVSTFLLGET